MSVYETASINYAYLWGAFATGFFCGIMAFAFVILFAYAFPSLRKIALLNTPCETNEIYDIQIIINTLLTISIGTKNICKELYKIHALAEPLVDIIRKEYEEYTKSNTRGNNAKVNSMFKIFDLFSMKILQT